MTKEKTKEKKSDIIVVGNASWKHTKNVIIHGLQKATTEEEFIHVIMGIYHSLSTSEEEMQAKRRLLGLPET